ncbi:MAG: transposase, partial [Calditrichaeota bacterium]
MKRRVQFVQGNYYHVYNRGANRDKIFREDENYLFLLKRLGKFALKFNISVIAYCLIPNHYHFLLRQNSEKSINDFMQRTFNSYTKAFNR